MIGHEGEGMNPGAHVERGMLLAYMDGEADAGVAEAVARHVAGCDECARTLRGLRATGDVVHDALGRLEGPPLRMAAARAVVRGRAGRPAAGRGRGVRRALPRAAVVVLVLAAGASAAVVPDSPLRRWLGERLKAPGPPVDSVRVAAPSEASEAREASDAIPAPPPMSGISVVPDEGWVQIAVMDALPGAELRVRHAAATDVRLLVERATDGLNFRTAPGRVDVSGAGDARVTVVLPRSLSRASVEVNGRSYVVKEDGEIIPRESPSIRSDTLIVFRVRG